MTIRGLAVSDRTQRALNGQLTQSNTKLEGETREKEAALTAKAAALTRTQETLGKLKEETDKELAEAKKKELGF